MSGREGRRGGRGERRAGPAADNVVGLPVAPLEPYMTRRQFAQLLGVSLSTVDRWLCGGMPSETWGLRARRIRPSIALAWLRSRGYVREASRIRSVPPLEEPQG